MPKAACYCRVSTSKESQLESLDKQHEFFRAFFENHPEYELYELYTDEGVSAKSMKRRAAFLRMIRDAGQKKFDIIFVKDVSRFARNARDFFNALDQVTRAGVRINFITLDMTSEPANEFMLGLLALVAQEESANLSKKTKFGKDVTAAKGRVPNFVFGYDRVDNYTLKPNEAEAEWVRSVFDMYVSGELGTAKIAQKLNECGVVSKKLNIGAWTQHTVSRMLKNELYIGNVVNRKSEVVDFREGRRRARDEVEWITVHRPEFRIVSDELFEAARALIAQRNGAFRTEHRRASTKYPLSNLLVCANGHAFKRRARGRNADSGRNAYGKQDAVWVCAYRNANGVNSCANGVKVVETELLAAILAFLIEAAYGKERIVREAVKYLSEAAGRLAEGSSLPALEREKRRLELKRARYLELYAEGLIGKEDAAERLGSLDTRLGAIKEAAASARGAGPCADIERAVRDYIDVMDIDILNNPLLKSLFERFIVFGDGRVHAVFKAVGGETAAGEILMAAVKKS